MEYIVDFLIAVAAGVAVDCIRKLLDRNRKGR